jgi:hypothetical protein
MSKAWWVLAVIGLGACAEDEVVRRPDPLPSIELSTVEAPPRCMPIQGVEVRSGSRDPAAHEVLKAFAAERGANYVVLDAFGVVSNDDDIVAVSRARLFRCPVELVCYRCSCPAPQ